MNGWMDEWIDGGIADRKRGDSNDNIELYRNAAVRRVTAQSKGEREQTYPYIYSTYARHLSLRYPIGLNRPSARERPKVSAILFIGRINEVPIRNKRGSDCLLYTSYASKIYANSLLIDSPRSAEFLAIFSANGKNPLINFREICSTIDRVLSGGRKKTSYPMERDKSRLCNVYHFSSTSSSFCLRGSRGNWRSKKFTEKLHERRTAGLSSYTAKGCPISCSSLAHLNIFHPLVTVFPWFQLCNLLPRIPGFFFNSSKFLQKKKRRIPTVRYACD